MGRGREIIVANNDVVIEADVIETKPVTKKGGRKRHALSYEADPITNKMPYRLHAEQKAEMKARVGRVKGQKSVAPDKWIEIINYYLNGHTGRETCQKYGVGEKALYYQLGRRNVTKIAQEKEELTEEDIAELDREPALKDRIKAELNVARDNFELTAKANQRDIQPLSAIENEVFRLKIYDEVLPILKEKNPILAKNLSVISAKIMTRANALLDTDLTPRELNDIATALQKINDVLQIIPKTQPLIAQQFNINNKQEKDIESKDVNIKVEFI